MADYLRSMAEVKDLQSSQGLTWHPSTRLPQESREGQVEDDAVQRVEKYEFMRSVIGVYIGEALSNKCVRP